MKFKSLLVVLTTVLIGLPFISYGKEDLSALRKEAEQGDASAQLNLGKAYYKGEGVPQDYKEAVKWYRLAAEQGNMDAQYNMGLAYGKGNGVPRDFVKAYAWLNLSAYRGHDASIELRSIILEMMSPPKVEEALRVAREYAKKYIKQ